MRRFRVLMLGTVLLLLGAAGAVRFFAPVEAAPPMSLAVARAIVERGTSALARRDPGGAMALIAPNASVFGYGPETLRANLEQMASDAGPGDLRVDTHDLVARRQGIRETFAVSIVVSQRAPKADIVYYRLRLTCDVERRRTTRWLGLLRRDEWLITRMSSVPPIEMQ